MMNTIRKRLRSERGDGEIVTTLLMFPLAFWLIFSLIDVSLYFQARTSVQNVTRDATRQVAVWGGNNSPLNTSGMTVQAAAQKQLTRDGGGCTPGNCSGTPTVTCSPNIATVAGQPVTCTTTYRYSAINKGNPITGFSNFMNRDIVITETARSETGFR